MTAVILATGVARRRAPLTDHTQKSLPVVGDRPILAGMLGALHDGRRAARRDRGRARRRLGAEPSRRHAPARMTIRLHRQPRLPEGLVAVASLCARDVIEREPTLIMDADVVSPRELSG